MCGILMVIRRENATRLRSSFNALKSSINRRGDQDNSASFSCCFESRDVTFTLEFYASVLNLRSNQKSTQPLTDESGNIFLFNGEVYECASEDQSTMLDGCSSDTEFVFQKLTKSCNDEELLSAISSLRGPFSYVYFSSLSGKLWFGKDFIGRRSLNLMRSVDGDELVISSVAPLSMSNEYNIQEIAATGVQCIDLTSSEFDTSTFLWNTSISGSIQKEDNGHLKVHLPVKSNQDQSEQTFDQVLNSFIHLMDDSVRKRVTCHNFKCKICALNSNQENCQHPSIAILFSGGIDSTIISLMAHKHIPIHIPIDLLNVSFDSNAPDRVTGLETLKELRLLCPDRLWNFVSIDIDKQELDLHSNYIRDELVFPSVGTEKVIDESVGCSLWFAARASGHIISYDGNQVNYSSPARILLSGLGADEQLAGYSRHRRIFYSDGVEGLKKELAMDLDRISSRNLGRDDRVIGDHGKETRHPFLDENVISFLNQVPIDYKCNLKLDRGVGEKYLLRQACKKLGLSHERCTTLKRAIQFGSRIAQITRNSNNKRKE